MSNVEWPMSNDQIGGHRGIRWSFFCAGRPALTVRAGSWGASQEDEGKVVAGALFADEGVHGGEKAAPRFARAQARERG